MVYHQLKKSKVKRCTKSVLPLQYKQQNSDILWSWI